jgi:hypothetical protein
MWTRNIHQTASESLRLIFVKVWLHEANGVKVSAFFVDHGPVKPAFGGLPRSLSRDIGRHGLQSLIKFSQNVDVLIHELGQSKDAAILSVRRTN